MDPTPETPPAEAVRHLPTTDWHSHDAGWGCESALPFLWCEPMAGLVATEPGRDAVDAALVRHAAL